MSSRSSSPTLNVTNWSSPEILVAFTLLLKAWASPLKASSVALDDRLMSPDGVTNPFEGHTGHYVRIMFDHRWSPGYGKFRKPSGIFAANNILPTPNCIAHGTGHFELRSILTLGQLLANHKPDDPPKGVYGSRPSDCRPHGGYLKGKHNSGNAIVFFRPCVAALSILHSQPFVSKGKAIPKGIGAHLGRTAKDWIYHQDDVYIYSIVMGVGYLWKWYHQLETRNGMEAG